MFFPQIRNEKIQLERDVKKLQEEKKGLKSEINDLKIELKKLQDEKKSFDEFDKKIGIYSAEIVHDVLCSKFGYKKWDDLQIQGFRDILEKLEEKNKGLSDLYQAYHQRMDELYSIKMDLEDKKERIEEEWERKKQQVIDILNQNNIHVIKYDDLFDNKE